MKNIESLTRDEAARKGAEFGFANGYQRAIEELQNAAKSLESRAETLEEREAGKCARIFAKALAERSAQERESFLESPFLELFFAGEIGLEGKRITGKRKR